MIRKDLPKFILQAIDRRMTRTYGGKPIYTHRDVLEIAQLAYMHGQRDACPETEIMENP